MREKFLYLTAHKKKNNLKTMAKSLKYLKFIGDETALINCLKIIGSSIENLKFSDQPDYDLIRENIECC